MAYTSAPSSATYADSAAKPSLRSLRPYATRRLCAAVLRLSHGPIHHLCAPHTPPSAVVSDADWPAVRGQIITSRATSTHRTSKAGRKRRRSAAGTCGTSGRGTPRTDGRLGCGRDYCRRARSFGSRGTSEGPRCCWCCCCAAAVGYEYDAGRCVVEETQLLRPVPLERMRN